MSWKNRETQDKYLLAYVGRLLMGDLSQWWCNIKHGVESDSSARINAMVDWNEVEAEKARQEERLKAEAKQQYVVVETPQPDDFDGRLEGLCAFSGHRPKLYIPWLGADERPLKNYLGLSKGLRPDTH